MWILAAESRRIDWSSIALWLALLALLIMVAVVAVVMIRRAVRAGESAQGAGFTLQDLREMRDRGDLTEVEYQAARTIALGEAAAALKDREGLSDTPRRGEKRT